MAGTAQDVEAGRAFVTVYLRRTNYDQQVDDLERDRQVDDLKRDEGDDRPDRPSQAIASQTKASGSFSVGTAIARGAAFKAGAVALAKYIPLFRETTKISLTLAPALASVGVAAAATTPALAATGVAATATAPAITAVVVASTAAAPALAATGTAATVAAPALAITGVAASGAAVGLGAMWAAAAPIVIPLAAIAAAAGLVYAAFFKWDELPLVVKALMLVLFPLVVVVRMAVLAFKLLKLAVAIVTAPFWLAAKAVRGFFAAIGAIPRVIVATIGHIRRLAAAAVKMAVKVSQAAAKMAVKVAESAVEIAKSVAAIPGNLARNTSAALRDVGTSIARIGAIATGISGAIVGSATLAARSWARYGETIRGVQNDLLRFQLTAEEASIIARVSQRTGESIENLARDMRDGTRDFSRWRNELQLSGSLMSGAGLSAALALSRAYWSLKESVLGLKDNIAAALGPTLIESAELFTGMVRGITRWVKENKPLVVQVFKIASAAGIAAGVITMLGGAIAGVGTIITPFAAWLATIAGVLALVEIRTEAGRSFWGAYGESVRRVFETVSRYLGQMLEFTNRTIGGIKNALMAGDLALAVDIMWNAAKIAWISALLEIDELTSGTFGAILQSLAAGRWAAAGQGAVNALRIAWLEGVDFLIGIWTRVVDAADTAWDGIWSAADDAWAGILSGFDTMITGLKTGLAGILGWAIENVFVPLAKAAVVFDKLVFNTGAGDKAVATINDLKDDLKDLERSIKEDEEAKVKEDEEAKVEGRPAKRKTVDELAQLAEALKNRADRRLEIETLKQQQAASAGQSGPEAKQERTASQKALDAALAAAKVAADALAKNKLQESDFAVSQDVQSIARFSGEALGLSVGRGQDPAEKTLKLTAEQNKLLKDLKKLIYKNGRDIRKAMALGGFG